MTAMRLGAAVFREDDPDTGLPLAGGKVWFYDEGTTTLKTTWADVYKVAANTNPVILDASGRAEVFIDGRYSVKVTKADDTVLYTSTVRSPDETPDVTEALVTAVLVMPVYRTIAEAAAATIPSGVKRIKVLGYAAETDYGGAEYIRVSSTPTHTLRFRSTDRYLPGGTTDSANGGWWAIGQIAYPAAVAGAVGDGVTNDAAAIDAVNDANAPGDLIDLLGRDYEYGGTFTAVKSFTNGRIIDDATTHDFFPARSWAGVGADAQGDIDPTGIATATPTTASKFFMVVAGEVKLVTYAALVALLQAEGVFDPVQTGGAVPTSLVTLSAGSGTWTVPAGITKLNVYMQGGEGADWDSASSTGSPANSGADTTFGANTATGGAGGTNAGTIQAFGKTGQFKQVLLTVSPGDEIAYSVGAGGVGTIPEATGANGYIRIYY